MKECAAVKVSHLMWRTRWAMGDVIRIHVLKDDIPHFLVHTLARDEFISEMVTELFGTRIDGSGWEWEAEEIVLSEKDFAVAS